MYLNVYNIPHTQTHTQTHTNTHIYTRITYYLHTTHSYSDDNYAGFTPKQHIQTGRLRLQVSHY